MTRLYLVEELAAEQHVSKDTIYDWLNSGVLVGFKLGGKTSPWRIDERDWDDFVERRRADALAERQPATTS